SRLQFVKILWRPILLNSPSAVIAGKFDIKECTFLPGKKSLHRSYNQTFVLVQATAFSTYARLCLDSFHIWIGRSGCRGRGRLRRGRPGGQIVHIASENTEFRLRRNRSSSGRGCRGRRWRRWGGA